MDYDKTFELLKKVFASDTDLFIEKLYNAIDEIVSKNQTFVLDENYSFKLTQDKFIELATHKDGFCYERFYCKKEKRIVADALIGNIISSEFDDAFVCDLSKNDDRLICLDFIAKIIDCFSYEKDKNIKDFTYYAYEMLSNDEFTYFYSSHSNLICIQYLISLHINAFNSSYLIEGANDKIVISETTSQDYALLLLDILENHKFPQPEELKTTIVRLFKALFPDYSVFKDTYRSIVEELSFLKRNFAQRLNEATNANKLFFSTRVNNIKEKLSSFEDLDDFLESKYKAACNDFLQTMDIISLFYSSYPFVKGHRLDCTHKTGDDELSLYLTFGERIKASKLSSLDSLISDYVCTTEIENIYSENKTNSFVLLLTRIAKTNKGTKYFEQIYASSLVNDAKKEKIVKDFFKSAFDEFKDVYLNPCTCLLEYKNLNIQPIFMMDISQKNIVVEAAFNAIKNNKQIVNQIVSGELQAAPMCECQDEDALKGWDFTNYLVCQIKAVERYLKEVLVQHHLDDIHRTSTERFLKPEFRYLQNRFPYIKKIQPVPKNIRDYFYIDDGPKYSLISSIGRINLSNVANPTAEDLSSPESKSRNLECGSAFIAIKFTYRNEKQLSQLFTTDYFYQFGLQDVRNENLHTLMIDSIRELKEKRTKLAFWFIYCILNLGERGVLYR